MVGPSYPSHRSGNASMMHREPNSAMRSLHPGCAEAPDLLTRCVPMYINTYLLAVSPCTLTLTTHSPCPHAHKHSLTPCVPMHIIPMHISIYSFPLPPCRQAITNSRSCRYSPTYPRPNHKIPASTLQRGNPLAGRRMICNSQGNKPVREQQHSG